MEEINEKIVTKKRREREKKSSKQFLIRKVNSNWKEVKKENHNSQKRSRIYRIQNQVSTNKFYFINYSTLCYFI